MTIKINLIKIIKQLGRGSNGGQFGFVQVEDIARLHDLGLHLLQCILLEVLYQGQHLAFVFVVRATRENKGMRKTMTTGKSQFLTFPFTKPKPNRNETKRNKTKRKPSIFTLSS